MAQGAFENAKGGAGNDTLYGGEDNNVIEGSEGSDLLFGFGGNDTLNGQGGSNQLFGGEGSDTFVFDDNAGSDVIYDFEDGLDLIDLSNHSTINSFADFLTAATQTGDHVLVDLGNGSAVNIQQEDLNTQLDQSDFIF